MFSSSYMKKILISLFVLGLIALPVFAFAQIGGPRPDFTYANDSIDQIVLWAQRGVTFLMVLATLFFVWTVIGYIREKDGTKATEKKNAMLRGIVGLFVIVAIWGIIRVISNTLGVNGTNTVVPACPPGLAYDQFTRRCQ